MFSPAFFPETVPGAGWGEPCQGRKRDGAAGFGTAIGGGGTACRPGESGGVPVSGSPRVPALVPECRGCVPFSLKPVPEVSRILFETPIFSWKWDKWDKELKQGE